MSDHAAPWRLETDLSKVTVVDAEGMEVGFIKGPISRSQLVAAAPDGLEAAEKARDALDRIAQGEDANEVIEDTGATEALSRFIRKAKGEHPSTSLE